ncbi:4-coumarate--CoA ligase [Desulfovibrio sp. JC010]|uniref:AMP-binding enzyme n=1 Tax=Desulfovibrio sp. JC010 TaxID=2593641 RepID=UPI0013D7DB8E|nr:4-coumarate--CoA ligase [Desulfovibrio sp. JC010]NDV26742.1 AMP-binding protein [Desulfovibrio sp. JC010]
MSATLTLTTQDIGEMISSALLAEMDYSRKLELCQGQSLADGFIPGDGIFQNPEAILERIATQFGVDPAQLYGNSIARMAERVFKQTNGRPHSLTFFTSGSTGTPVPAKSDFADLEQEIHSLAKLFADRKQIVSFVPRHHIYGFLFSILLPKALDIPVEYWPPLPGAEQIKKMRSGDLIIAFPLLWNKLQKLDCRFPENVFGVTSTGPCPAQTITGLQAQGLARMTEVYGSSETGGVGYRHDPAQMYSLLDHWENTGDSTIVRTSMDGTRRSHKLQDNLQWQGKRFSPLKRTDKAVQVGGINVYPARVEKIFRELPKVKECSVRLMRPEEGERLKIFIVPASETENAALEKELRNLVIDKLSRFEMPGKYDFGPALPVSDMGKLCDW